MIAELVEIEARTALWKAITKLVLELAELVEEVKKELPNELRRS